MDGASHRLSFRIFDVGARAVRQKEAGDLLEAAIGGHVQARVARAQVGRVHVRAGLQEELGRSEVAHGARHRQERRSVAVPRVGVLADGEEIPERLAVAKGHHFEHVDVVEDLALPPDGLFLLLVLLLVLTVVGVDGVDGGLGRGVVAAWRLRVRIVDVVVVGDVVRPPPYHAVGARAQDDRPIVVLILVHVGCAAPG